MLQFQINENEDEQDWLRQQVRQYNVDRSPFHATKRAEGTQRITLLANRDDHRIGGISGEVYWGWLHIEWFFVVEEERGSGLGATLLNRLEAWAREAGVNRIRVETFSFQALPFYERHGFVEVGRIDDYPPGASYHLLVKQVDR